MAKEKTFLDELIEAYGEESLVKAYTNGHPTISTGSLALDVSTGIGGIPVGRFSEIYGPEAGGKTTLSLAICKNAIENGLKSLYIDVENSIDVPYVESLIGGSYTEDMMTIVQPDSAEDAFKMAEMGIKAGFRCIIFDSIAAISPKQEVETEYGKQAMAIAPRLTNQFLKKTRNKILEGDVAFIMTNQVRANVGSYMGGYITPGGYALKHYTSLRIYLSKSSPIEENNNTIGHVINFVIKKNKLAIPYREAETNLIYGKGIDYYRDALKFGVLLGAIKMRGSYLAFEDNVLGQGIVKSMENLDNNKETLDRLVEMCYNIAGVKYPPVRATADKEKE